MFFRFVAIAAFIAAIVLFVIAAAGSTLTTALDWGFVCLAAGLLAFCLEGIPVSGPRAP